MPGRKSRPRMLLQHCQILCQQRCGVQVNMGEDQLDRVAMAQCRAGRMLVRVCVCVFVFVHMCYHHPTLPASSAVQRN